MIITLKNGKSFKKIKKIKIYGETLHCIIDKKEQTQISLEDIKNIKEE